MHMPPKRSSLKHLSERLFLHWFLLIVKSSVSKFPCKKCLHSARSRVRVNTKAEFSKMFGKLRSIQTYNCKNLVSKTNTYKSSPELSYLEQFFFRLSQYSKLLFAKILRPFRNNLTSFRLKLYYCQMVKIRLRFYALTKKQVLYATISTTLLTCVSTVQSVIVLGIHTMYFNQPWFTECSSDELKFV